MPAKIIHVFDMDGVLANSEHRYRIIPETGKIDLQHWRDNEHLAYQDKPGPLFKQYQDNLKNPDITVIIATARVLNDPDECWIRDKLGTPNATISRRGNNDTRGGAELKIKGLKRLLNLRPFKVHSEMVMFEDNISYLKAICDYFKCRGVYVPSNQGH